MVIRPAHAATTLLAGDIAIVGMNCDNPDEFAFVLLRDIEAGTEIKFTDNGWESGGSFRPGEGTLTWTASGDMSAGTVVNPDVGSMQFAIDGDQILAYQGDDSSPTFIYALNNEGAQVWQDNATDPQTSALPTGLINGSTAVAVQEYDNVVYTGTTSGTKTELLAAISNPANWSGDNSNRQTMPSDPFTPTALTLSSLAARSPTSQATFFRWPWVALAGAVGLAFGGVAVARRLLGR